MNVPTLTIVAGPNGSGKSTLTASAREIFQHAPVLDPDAMIRSLQETIGPHHSDIEAGRRVLSLAEELIASRQSFTVETTLSGNSYLRMASRAKAAGFRIMVIFVGTASPEINIERVRARVEKGGHDIPEEIQRRRYPRSLNNIKKLLPQMDFAILLDNSTDNGYALVAFGQNGTMHWNEPVPDWAAQLHSMCSTSD